MQKNEVLVGIYRYFYLNREKNIFSNLTQLEFDSADEYLAYIREHNLSVKSYNEHYLRCRFNTEKALYEQFVRKGGKPRIKHPYYFTLGKCDEWFYGRKDSFGCVELFLNEFDPEVISFTYGDSVPTFMEDFQDGKEYRSQVYTWEEIKELIEKYGMPNVWNTFEKFGPENYIEVQVWSDSFNSLITNNRTRFNDIGITELSTRIIMANPNFPDDAIKQKSVETYLQDCKKHPYWSWFSSLISRTSPDSFCLDYVHGIPHAYKCAFMAFVLAMQLELSTKDFKTLVYAAFYHDVGRRYYGNGKKHGVISSEKVDLFIDSADEVHLWHLKDALAKHDDKPQPADDDNVFLTWVRDLDSLDYLRLGISRFSTRYLKTNVAKTMIRLSLELNICMYLDDQFIVNLIRG